MNTPKEIHPVKLMKVAAVIALTLLAGCQSRTQYGECVGIGDDQKPTLEYRLSVRNTFLAVVFFQTLFVPIIVLANETSCPIGPKG
jgi:hypothetical protein